MLRGTGKDVADLAGVSTKTVSRVINGDPAVAPATRQRVQAAIDKLGYRQSHAASSLRRGRTRTLRIVIHLREQRLEQEQFQGALIGAVIDRAAAAGYSVLLDLTRSGDSLAQLARFADTRSDGTILLDGREQSPVVQAVTATNQPVVILVNPDTGSGAAAIDADFVGGARAAVNYLIQLGHRRIAHLSDDMRLHSSRARLLGYQQALQAAGLPCDDRLVIPAGYLQAHGAQAAELLLDRGLECTALFCVNDLTALGAIDVLRQRGWRVPEDISVVGFDDIALAQWSSPPLTTLRIPWYEMAAVAADQLIQALESGAPLESRLFPVALQVRGTTGPALPSRSGMGRERGLGATAKT